MSRVSKVWNSISKVLHKVGAEGAGYADFVKALPRINPNSISSQLWVRWNRGEVNVLNEEPNAARKIYVLPEYGGTSIEAFNAVGEAPVASTEEVAVQPSGNGRKKPRVARAGRRVSVTVSLRIHGRQVQIDLDEAVALHRDLTTVIGRFGTKQ